MASESNFVDSLPDLLSSLGEIHIRRMFGGYGVFKNGLMFGLVASGRLYLRTDDETKGSYIERGLEPFVFGERNGVEIVSRYYEPPEAAFINPQKMKPWAAMSWEATQRSAKPKVRKPKAKKTGTTKKAAAKTSRRKTD